MLDQDTARALLTIADEPGARVALVGDRHQLPAVGRGGVLDLAARWADPTACVTLDRCTASPHTAIIDGQPSTVADIEYAQLTLAMRAGDATRRRCSTRCTPRGQIRVHAETRLTGSAGARRHRCRRSVTSGPHGAVVVGHPRAGRRAQRCDPGPAGRRRRGRRPPRHRRRRRGADRRRRPGRDPPQRPRPRRREPRHLDRHRGRTATARLTVAGPSAGQRHAARRVRRAHTSSSAYATTAHGAQGDTATTAHLVLGEHTTAAAGLRRDDPRPRRPTPPTSSPPTSTRPASSGRRVRPGPGRPRPGPRPAGRRAGRRRIRPTGPPGPTLPRRDWTPYSPNWRPHGPTNRTPISPSPTCSTSSTVPSATQTAATRTRPSSGGPAPT